MSANSSSDDAPGEADFHAAIEAGSGFWYSACLRITRNPQLAEDAVQDAMLRAWKNRHQFKHQAKLQTWIHSIAVNAALTLLRNQRPGVFESLTDEVVDPSPSAEEAHEHEALHAELDTALTRLTEAERLCFVLRHLEQWNLNEIAVAVDKNANAVKQALFRGVQKLRQDMPTLASPAQ